MDWYVPVILCRDLFERAIYSLARKTILSLAFYTWIDILKKGKKKKEVIDKSGIRTHASFDMRVQRCFNSASHVT